MSGSPGSAGSNPRKFSEKIALHNQKQAEETRAFEQLMTDLTVSRVQFQKIQQLRLSQTRAQYYGGSLPNVNQIGTVNTDFQGTFPTSPDVVRGTRHHGLVERVHRERSRVNSPHRRPMDKHGRQVESSPYGNAYLSPPPDNSWRRTNSDSALHTSAMNPNPQDPFGPEQQLGRVPPQRNASMNEADTDGPRDVFSFPALASEEGLRGVSKPLPKQLWEAKKVQSLSSRPKSCEVPGISIFPSPEQSMGLSHYQGMLNTGGSLPDLSNLHFPSPLPTPLDPEDGRYPSLSGGSSTGNLPAAMMHLGIGNSQGLSSSLSNPSIHSSLRLSSLSASPPGALNSSPRRRPAPISPLTLSPSSEPRRSLGKPLSPTMSPSLSPITQGVALDTSRLPMEPPPPYPMYKQSHPAVQHSSQRNPQAMSPLSSLPLDFSTNSQNNMASFFNDPFMEPQGPSCQSQSKALSYQLEQFGMLDCGMGSVGGASCLDPGSSLYYSQAALMGLDSGQSNMQESLQSRQNMLYSNCSGGVPNIILTDDSNPSQSKDISRALSAVPECFDSEGGFPLEDELRIEPLSLDGLSMLSDPDMVLPDPSVEDSFRSDRL